MATANTKRKVDKGDVDLYNTPPEALEAAWDEGIFDDFQTFWDPCNGLGKISNFLKERGKSVFTSDIVDYGDQDKVLDFLEAVRNSSEYTLPSDVCIVMNPPFKLTEKFIDKALSLFDNLIMFNRATVLEAGKRSKKHHEGVWPLKKFWSFANRVSCTKGVDGEPTDNAVWYGWYRYDKNYHGEPRVGWLFVKRKKKA